MPQAELTDQQRRVLEAVDAFSREHGYPPTLREIGRAVDLSNVNAVRGHVSALVRKGYVQRTPDKARSIRVVGGPSGLSRLKRRIHEILRTDEGVVHRVVYALAWATWRRRPYWTGLRRQWLADAFQRECVEHGWKPAGIRIQPDHVAIVLQVWPNHSPEQVVRRLRSAARSVKRRHMRHFPRGWLWAKGYAAGTDPALLDELVAAVLEAQETQTPSTGGGGGPPRSTSAPTAKPAE
jgi:REP element-mobilizing transposase RayT